ncbi:MAG: guanylate kinase [Bradymonadia bacterium]
MVLLVMAACSGTGKSTLARRVLAARPKLRLSVSHTTRAPRPGEENGREYHFVERSRFEAMVRAEAFAEWAEYAGNLYGTSHAEIRAAEGAGVDLLFDVDVVGAFALKRAFPLSTSVFVLPPSFEELEARLRGRGTESETSITRRLAAARREVREADAFDYLVVNEAVDTGAAELMAVYDAATLTRAERQGLLDALRHMAERDAP